MAKSEEAHSVQLPKDALSRVNLGQSFAEYDKVLARPGVFVKTPAIEAALDGTRSKCFFVGRRGTGKTALSLHLLAKGRSTFAVHPNVLSPSGLPEETASFADTRQRPFRSLVAAFDLAIAYEAVAQIVHSKLVGSNTLEKISRERNIIEQNDFDTRLLVLFEQALEPIRKKDERAWLQQLKRAKDVTAELDSYLAQHTNEVVLLIDRLDESWDGSDRAVVSLMALMHACVEISSRLTRVRPLLFLRENIFERVRQIDNEFARLETCVVSLDWTHEMLLELVERRLVLPFGTKPALGGPAWNCFFDLNPIANSQSLVFDYCQQRPRDVLTYCAMAIETAQSRRHARVSAEDLVMARKKFSESRLKDLGDEYSENYPRIDLVLARFYGLGTDFTISGVTAFVQSLIVDPEVKKYCGTWLYAHTAPEQFVELLFNLGFCGVKSARAISFRSMGTRQPTPPAVTPNSVMVVHPSYREALNLQDVVINTLEGRALRTEGLIQEIPESVSLDGYMGQLETIKQKLPRIPKGKEGAKEFEDCVGEVVKLCFFKSLTNVQARSRDIDGAVIRDWIASNVAPAGFWEMVRQKHLANQVVFECKNYDSLSAADFHQTAYYMNDKSGRFAAIVFRGDINRLYYRHIRRIADDHKGMVILLNEGDLQVFLRQAANGKVKDGHLRDRYDATVRDIS